jgi:hypothetical protein
LQNCTKPLILAETAIYRNQAGENNETLILRNKRPNQKIRAIYLPATAGDSFFVLNLPYHRTASRTGKEEMKKP